MRSKINVGLNTFCFLSMFFAVPIPGHPSMIRADFSGYLTSSTEGKGDFSGVLIADWDKGVVQQFYADVAYLTGQRERYSIYENWDFISVTQGPISKKFYADGTIEEYSVVPEEELLVQRSWRTPEGDVSVQPEWVMVLEVEPRSIFAWAEYSYTIDNCNGTPCLDVSYDTLLLGEVTDLQISTVPIPSALWLFSTGAIAIFALGVFRRNSPKASRP